MIDIKVYKFKNAVYEPITGVLQGNTITETIDDTLDTGLLIVNTADEELVKLWQSIKVIADGFMKCFVISDIQRDDRHVLNAEKYRYTISLIEPTKYLEKVVCSSMSFTNPSNTLKEQIERALLNAEPVLSGQPRFRMSQALVDFLGNAPGEDFFFEKPILREVLDEMLSVKNARCEVYEITDFDNIIIDYYDQTKKGKQIGFSVNELLNRRSIENSELLGTSIEAYGENAFSENREPVYHPSPNGWDTFKTEEAVLNANNAMMKTAFPIEEIKGFFLKDFPYRISWRYPDPDGAQPFLTHIHTETTLVDITDNVFEEELYKILSDSAQGADDTVNTFDYNKSNTIYYKRGTDMAGNIESRKQSLFFTTTNLQMAGLNAIYRYFCDFYYIHNPQYGVTNIYVSETINYPVYSVNNAMFRIQYIPYIDAHAKIDKLNYTGVPSTIISNQNDKTIDLGRYGQNLYGQINRLGNKELSIDKIHYSMADTWEVSDYTLDGYTVVSCVLAFHNNFIKANYQLSKDFVSINSKIGIDRKKRVYNIPLESFSRDILLKNPQKIYATFSNTPDSSALVLNHLKLFASGPKKTLTNALVKTLFKDNQESDLFELPVVGYSMATSILFKFKFVDNYSAGISSEGKIIGGRKQTPNPYVDNDGEYQNISITLFNDDDADRPNSYNSIKLLPKVQAEWYFNVIKYFQNEYKITKDAYEHHQFTIQYDLLSNDNDIIIGFAFAKLSGLLYNGYSSFRIFVSTTQKYNKLNAVYPLGTEIPNATVTLNGNSITVSGINLIFSKAWGIADNRGNLILGVNKVGENNIQATIWFYRG